MAEVAEWNKKRSSILGGLLVAIGKGGRPALLERPVRLSEAAFKSILPEVPFSA